MQQYDGVTRSRLEVSDAFSIDRGKLLGGGHGAPC